MRLSVVTPYYENHRTLQLCIDSFAAQRVRPDEIIVVDDGSPHSAAATAPADLPLRIMRAAHGGQSAATNAGIAAARGDIILLTCADIVADRELVAHHLEAHSGGGRVGVAGPIRYAPWVPRTPFMQFLARDGVQFSFEDIPDPENMPANRCYAPNFSARAADLRGVDGFDLRFDYGFQDTDLGMRLAASGVRMIYRSQALAHHDHPNALRPFAARNSRIGAALLVFLQKYPLLAQRSRAGNVAFYTPLLADVPRLPQLIDQAEALEARLAATPALAAPLTQRMWHLYAMIFRLATLAGMRRHPERLAALNLPLA